MVGHRNFTTAMELTELQTRVHDLIVEGERLLALKELAEYVGENNGAQDLKNSITLLSSQCTDLDKEKTGGTISREDASLSENRINDAILKLLDTFFTGVEADGPEESPSLTTSQEPASTLPPASSMNVGGNKYFTIIILAALVVFLCAGVYLLFFGDNTAGSAMSLGAFAGTCMIYLQVQKIENLARFSQQAA